MTRIATILCGLCAMVATAQPVPTGPVMVQLPVIDEGVNGYIIQSWQINGMTFGRQITTNWSTRAVIVVNPPKTGGKFTNYVQTFTIVTNRVTALRDASGHVYAFTLSDPQPPIWEGFEIRNLETTTNLADPAGWHPVGWDTRREPTRYFRVRGTNTVEATALYLNQVTFTN